jgi:NAD(P)-dependent dehydrogenase (short-subunit alcohol dehydrogenase family)
VTDSEWTAADMPDLAGVRAVVTGANSGLGFHTTLELARQGANVLLGVRDETRGADAVQQVLRQVPVARLEVRTLDLADLASVRAFADTVGQLPLDLLVNNAGVMAIPHRLTADGFEMQFGTNHLGHVALTGLLLPALLKGSLRGGPPRVVTLSSMIHRRGRLDREDLMGERTYSPWRAYGQSKLANLLFMRELQRRADAARVPLLSLGAHPGYAATNLQFAGPRMRRSRLREVFARLGNVVLAQPAAHGAWPILRAATDPDARGGDYYGPGGFAEQRGHPVRVGMSAQAMDDADAAWLWERSVELTGVGFEALAPPAPAPHDPAEGGQSSNDTDRRGP